MDTNETSLEDQRQQALKHYEEASNAIMHWSSFVRDAILAYDPKQNSHKHGIMQAGCNHMFVEARDIVLKDGFICVHCQQYKPAAVGNSADGKGMSVELHECPVCKQKAGKSYLLSKLPTICQKCDHAWNRA